MDQRYVPGSRALSRNALRPLLLLLALVGLLVLTAPGRALLALAKDQLFASPPAARPAIAGPAPAPRLATVAPGTGIRSASAAAVVQVAPPLHIAVPEAPAPTSSPPTAPTSSPPAPDAQLGAGLQALQRQVQGGASALGEQLAALAAASPTVGARPTPAGNPPVPSGPASPFCGVWEGAFNGRMDGEMALYVQPDGEFRGVLSFAPRQRLYGISGRISAEGAPQLRPNALMGAVGLFEMHGGFSRQANDAYGYWSPGAAGHVGSWYLRAREGAGAACDNRPHHGN